MTTTPNRRVVLVLSKLEQVYLDMMRAVDPRVELVVATDADRATSAAPDAEIIVAWQVPPAVLERAGRLRWIHTTAAGVDGLLVPPGMDGRVLLTSSVGVHVGLPEHVMGLVLAFSRRLHLALRNQMAHRWDRAPAVGEGLPGK